MEAKGTPFFLFIGSCLSESASSKLKTSNIFYRQKLLESTTFNWAKIVALVDDSDLTAALVKLTSNNYRQISQPTYSKLAEKIFSGLGKSRHIVFVHEATLGIGIEPDDPFPDTAPIAKIRPAAPMRATGPAPEHPFSEPGPETDKDVDLDWFGPEEIDTPDEYEDWRDYHYQEYLKDHFAAPSENDRAHVGELLARNSIEVIPYKTNAELSVMAATFVEQTDKHLLFRVYIPEGRLWSNEADKLLGLFRDWLTKVKRQRIRQDGYRTGHGEVYEFYAEDSSAAASFSGEFDKFKNFLDLCIQQPSAAERILEAEHVNRLEVAGILDRFTKEARRLRVDIKHDFEMRSLSVRHRLESELTDTGLTDTDLDALVNSIMPSPAGILPAISSVLGGQRSTTPELHMNINQQFIETVQGNAIQGIQGGAHFGAEAQQLLRLVELHGGDRREALTSSLYELEDNDARDRDRITARQRLKGFMVQAAKQISPAVVQVLQKYLEARIGL